MPGVKFLHENELLHFEYCNAFLMGQFNFGIRVLITTFFR